MGEHDQTVLHDDDAHEDIHDDDRSFHPIDVGARVFQGAGGGANDPAYDNPDPYLDPDLYKHTKVFCFFHDKLIPDSVLVNVRPFSVTRWESLYSSLFGTETYPQLSHYPLWDTTDPSFAPVIDESYRVVGHLGWISGEQICVPIFTVAADSPSALVLEKARLGEERERILWRHDHPIEPIAFPVQRARDSWELPYISSLRKGPLKDGSEEQRHQNNINYYLAGGGEALVGCEFAKDLMASRRYESFLMNYRCLALVRPDGYLQGVFGVEKIPHQTREQEQVKQVLWFIDIALTIWMIIDIATISVALIRLTLLVAERVEIWAIKLVLDRGAKAALELAMREATALSEVGALAGPKAAIKEAMQAAARAKSAMEAAAAAKTGGGVEAAEAAARAREALAASEAASKATTLAEAERAAAKAKAAADAAERAATKAKAAADPVERATANASKAGQPSGPSVASPNMNIARETAGTGGIKALSGVRAADGSKKIVVEGKVLKSITRRGFEKNLVSGSDLGLPTYERLHLWGPRLGDEAAAGIWLGPGEINIGEQAMVEKLLQDLAIRAEKTGGRFDCVLRARRILPKFYRKIFEPTNFYRRLLTNSALRGRA